MLEDVFEAHHPISTQEISLMNAGMPRGSAAAVEPQPGNLRISKSFNALGRLLIAVLEHDNTKTGCRAVQHFAQDNSWP
jgi:hypothetical protein